MVAFVSLGNICHTCEVSKIFSDSGCKWDPYSSRVMTIHRSGWLHIYSSFLRPAANAGASLFHTSSVIYAFGVAMTFDPAGAPWSLPIFLKVAWSTFSPFVKNNRGSSTPAARSTQNIVMEPRLLSLFIWWVMTYFDATNFVVPKRDVTTNERHQHGFGSKWLAKVTD